jgi:hypothetical protein
VQQSEKIRENVKKFCNSIHCLALRITSIVSRVCRVRGLSCPGFVVSRVCHVQGLSCPGFVVSRVCRVQGLSVQGLSVYRNGGYIVFETLWKIVLPLPKRHEDRIYFFDISYTIYPQFLNGKLYWKSMFSEKSMAIATRSIQGTGTVLYIGI